MYSPCFQTGCWPDDRVDGENDDPIMATVLEINQETVKIDANHQLAGKNVIVDLRIIEVMKREA